jgi:hypothetical protein
MRLPSKPRRRAAPLRKPVTTRNSSGSSRRKESWPRSESISTKETGAAAALRPCTISRFSRVGNSQSLVNETTQKRVSVPRNAFATSPPCSAARSK